MQVFTILLMRLLSIFSRMFLNRKQDVDSLAFEYQVVSIISYKSDVEIVCTSTNMVE